MEVSVVGVKDSETVGVEVGTAAGRTVGIKVGENTGTADVRAVGGKVGGTVGLACVMFE